MILIYLVLRRWDSLAAKARHSKDVQSLKGTARKVVEM